MSINRRQILLGGVSAMLTLPFVGTAEASLVRPKWIEEEKNKLSLQGTMCSDMSEPVDLLKRCVADDQYKQREMDQLAERVRLIMSKDIAQKTGLEVRRVPDGEFVKGMRDIDIGTAVDWKIEDAKNGRWDIVARCFETMVENMVTKINDTKDEDSFISFFYLFDDPCMWKQRRCGFYCWAELMIQESRYAEVIAS